jgi:hypothetical protein
MLRPVQWPDFTTALIGRLGPLGMVGRAQLDSIPQPDSLRSTSSRDDGRVGGDADA